MLDREARDGLNVALNESQLVSIHVDQDARIVQVRFEVLTLPEHGAQSTDRVVILVASGVTRVVASLREGRWDDLAADVVTLPMDQLDATVRGFGGLPIYGWEFVDPSESSWEHWHDRLSLDEHFDIDSAAHVLELFQEGANRHLDVRVWFAELTVTDSRGREILLKDFIAGGVRWWDAMYAGDPRTSGHGIFPIRGE